LSGWKKPRRFERNLVVIGGGAAGLVTAYIAAALKARVTLIEQHRMGGDCLNTGCVPSKALIRSAKFLAQLARAKEFGFRDAHAEFDFASVMERVQNVVRAIEPHDSAERYSGLGVEVIEGAAKLVSPWEVDVTRHDGTTQRLTTRSIVIAAGGRPFVPAIPGLDEVGYLTSDTVWDLRELPRRLLVLGGGPIGSELAQAFARHQGLRMRACGDCLGDAEHHATIEDDAVRAPDLTDDLLLYCTEGHEVEAAVGLPVR